ncbi:hypothetical protein BDV93DRAFT_563655 [Ceratobasidium sp. AG-I]|nr:hypothetical protein BDV93DRAFT_563655 [Ceratobasidium sp. AG-I]
MPSFSFDSSANPSLASSLHNAGEGRIAIKFPLKLDWYDQQPCTNFTTLQHRKERRGLTHEYIVLKFTDGSICRLDRMGDPHARLDALRPQGSAAHDVAQCFRPEKLAEACLDTSDLVAEVVFPRPLDLLHVLLVCRAIHEGEKTCNYTLEGFNCYFFALAIQSALTRLVANWGDLIPQDDWSSCIKTTTDALSVMYLSPTSARRNPSVWLRIYSLLGTVMEDPARHVLEKIKNIYDHPALLQQINHALSGVLWHSDLGQVVDGVLESRVRDTMVQDLKNISLNTYHDQSHIPNSPLSPSDSSFDSNRAAVSTSVNEEIDDPAQRCKNTLTALVLLAASNHQVNPPALRQKRHQPYTGFPRLYPPSKRPPHLNFRSSETRTPRLQPTQTPQTIGNSPNMHRFVKEWICVIWALCVHLLLLCGMPLDFGKSHQYGLADETLRSYLSQLESDGRSSTADLSLALQEFRSFCETESSVVWHEFPWTHVHDLIKRHILHLLVSKETTCLQVTIQGKVSIEAMSVSSFQQHLLHRIKCHAKFVKRLKLGLGTGIYEELKDKLSQVWELIRNDDERQELSYAAVVRKGAIPSSTHRSSTPLYKPNGTGAYLSRPIHQHSMLAEAREEWPAIIETRAAVPLTSSLNTSAIEPERSLCLSSLSEKPGPGEDSEAEEMEYLDPHSYRPVPSNTYGSKIYRPNFQSAADLTRKRRKAKKRSTKSTSLQEDSPVINAAGILQAEAPDQALRERIRSLSQKYKKSCMLVLQLGDNKIGTIRMKEFELLLKRLGMETMYDNGTQFKCKPTLFGANQPDIAFHRGMVLPMIDVS